MLVKIDITGRYHLNNQQPSGHIMLWKLFAGALSLYLIDCIYILYTNEPTVELLGGGVMQFFGVAAVITYGFDIETFDRRVWSYLSKLFAVYIVYSIVRPLWVLWGMPSSGTDPTPMLLLWIALGLTLSLIVVVGYFQWLAMLRCARGEAVNRQTVRNWKRS
ncbi:hypothetical protein [Rhizobium leguminosarum]|uniref:hypothetical protein n=1 Tax=Rhizobium leguminosarum TaxID=384 RepID=UPI001FD91D2B|nr:hypothetical protein [Rhizobium leguminosarum]